MTASGTTRPEPVWQTMTVRKASSTSPESATRAANGPAALVIRESSSPPVQATSSQEANRTVTGGGGRDHTDRKAGSGGNKHSPRSRYSGYPRYWGPTDEPIDDGEQEADDWAEQGAEDDQSHALAGFAADVGTGEESKD